jgi:hypothetical protein
LPGLETALGYWWGYRVTGGVKGFWSNVDGDDTVGCRTGCVVVDPTGTVTASGPTLRTKTDRDVDYWGGQAELKFGNSQVERPLVLRYRRVHLQRKASILPMSAAISDSAANTASAFSALAA